MLSFEGGGKAIIYSAREGQSIRESYLKDPSDVVCPSCGPNQFEVVCFLDTQRMEQGAITQTSPNNTYTVVLMCHGCNRSAELAIDG